MDIKTATKQNGSTKPKANPDLPMEASRKSSSVETLMDIIVLMFIVQVIASAYKTRPDASTMFMASLPWIILTYFTAFGKQMYHIYSNMSTSKLHDSYHEMRDYIFLVVVCYAVTLGFSIFNSYLVYEQLHRNDHLKAGRFFLNTAIGNILTWCTKELWVEEQEQRKFRLTFITSSMYALMFANIAFGYFLSSGDLSVAGAVAMLVFVGVWIIAYPQHNGSILDGSETEFGGVKKSGKKIPNMKIFVEDKFNIV